MAKPLNNFKIEPSIEQLFDLTGKVALITGATGHLGSSMANALAEAGARVIVASRNSKNGKSTAEALNGEEKGRHFSVVIDQMNESSIQSGFSKAIQFAGHIDILICNGHEPLAADWTSVTAKQFNRQMENATGYFLLARHLREHAVKKKTSANIVMIGSMYGSVGSYPEVYQGIGAANPVAYQMLKGGIIQMVRHLGVYWAKDGIRVNCLSPGPFPSPKAASTLVARLKKKCPMGRIGLPYELKGALVFLASDASSYVTGQNLVVDGGWTAW